MTTVSARTAAVLGGVRDDQLDSPTPCAELSVCELVAHLGELASAFGAAAAKNLGELTDRPPGAGGYRLEDGWRDDYPARLSALAEAWRAPQAWQGMTRVGAVDLPGEVCGLVALTEVVVHGWDVAVATGQTYAVDDHTASILLEHLTAFTADGPVEGLFGAPVPVVDDAGDFVRALALSGRDPTWDGV
ncbi:TIGR03086 family metal-binding protein [Mycobacterium sp. NPDC003323]